MHTAHLIAIGNEILIGRTQDTNLLYLAKMLNGIGIRVIRFAVIPDDPSVIKQTLAESPAEILITTGGLGATLDDITRKTLADYFHCELVAHAPTLDRLHQYYARRGQQINNITAKMALVPARAVPLNNEVGAAPGLQFSLDGNRLLFCLPGVPHEVHDIYENQILPLLKRRFTQGVILQEVFRTVGIPESKLAQLIADIENDLPEYISLAYNPSISVLDLRLVLETNAHLATEHEFVFRTFVGRLAERIEAYCFGRGEETLEKKVGEMLVSRKLSIATAESCTGGALMARMVSVSGSSRYVKGGIIAYSNEIKQQELDVSPEILKEHGAVSELCAVEMAKNVRNKFKTDVALSVTGIAGPLGGSEEKPVGLVWIGYADAEKNYAKSFLFEQHRQRNIERTVVCALNLLRLELKGN